MYHELRADFKIAIRHENRSASMSPAKEGLAHFAIDAKTSLFTVQAFASGWLSVVAHSPKFAVRDFVGEMEFVPETCRMPRFI